MGRDDFNFFGQWDEFEEPEEKVDQYEEDARDRVIELVTSLNVATDRDI